jgi:hypothetical protein
LQATFIQSFNPPNDRDDVHWRVLFAILNLYQVWFLQHGKTMRLAGSLVGTWQDDAGVVRDSRGSTWVFAMMTSSVADVDSLGWRKTVVQAGLKS